MIQRGKHVVQRMLAKVCEHQKIGPLDIATIDDRIELKETPIAIGSWRIAVVVDARIVMSRCQANKTKQKAAKAQNDQPTNDRRAEINICGDIEKGGQGEAQHIVPVHNVPFGQWVDNAAQEMNIYKITIIYRKPSGPTVP